MNMTWGKHRGWPLEEVPDQYLMWALEHADAVKNNQILRDAIRARLGLDVEPPKAAQPNGAATRSATITAALECVKDVSRELSKRYHPDRGGSTAAMIALNHMYERLSEEMSRRFPLGR